MYLSPSGEKIPSPQDGKPLARAGSSKLLVGVAPINDENIQNYKIQAAVNKYNNSFSPIRQFPLAAYKCNFIRSKSPNSQGSLFDFSAEERGVKQLSPRDAYFQSRSRYSKSENIRKAESPSGEGSPAFPGLELYKQCFRNNSSNSPMGKGDGPPNSERPLSPELRYTGPDHFPTCHIYKSPYQPPKKQNILSQLKAHGCGLPVTRFMDDAAEKYSDLKSTRSVIEVLQDMSRKRMHGRDDSEDGVKRRCKGLGGDLVNEGESIYKPLFVPKGRAPTSPRKDQTTQTSASTNTSTESPSDSKAELRRKLARKNNEIAASLSSSVRVLFTKRKRAPEASSVANKASVSGEEATSKKQRVTEKPDSSPAAELATPVLKEKKTPVVTKSPKSPSNNDRLMTIFKDLQNEADVKLNAIKDINTSPGGAQFVRPAGSPEEIVNVVAKLGESSPSVAVPNIISTTPSVDIIKTTEAPLTFNFGASSSSSFVSSPTTEKSSTPNETAQAPPALPTLNFASPTIASTIISTPPPVTTTGFSVSPTAYITCTTTSVSTPITTSSAKDQKSETPQFQMTGTTNFSPLSTQSLSPASTGISFQPSTPLISQASPSFSFGTNLATPQKTLNLLSSEKTSLSTTPLSATKIPPSTSAPFSFGTPSTAAPPNATVSSSSAVASPKFTFGDKLTSTPTPSSPFSFGLPKTADPKPSSQLSPSDQRNQSNFYSKANENQSTPPSFLTTSKPETALSPTKAQTTVSAPFTFGQPSVSTPSFQFGAKPTATASPVQTKAVEEKVNSAGGSEIKWSFGAKPATPLSSSTSPSVTTVQSTTASETKPSTVFARLGVPVQGKHLGLPGKLSGESSKPTTSTTQAPFGGFSTTTTTTTTQANQFQNNSVTSTTQGSFPFTFGQTATSSAIPTTPAFSFGQNRSNTGGVSNTAAVMTSSLFPAYSPATTTAPATVATNTVNPFGQSAASNIGSTGSNTGFKFTATESPFKTSGAPQPATTTSAFSLMPTTTTSSFGLPTTQATNTFGQNIFGAEANKPSVAFGASTSATAPFTFGKTVATTTAPAPAFGQGTSLFAFGSKGQNTTFGATPQLPAAPAPVTTSQNTSFTATPSFGSLATPQQPLTSGFGQSSGVFGQGGGFSFGQGTTPATTAATAPTFSFGKSATTGNAPFSFGKAVTTSAPVFGAGSSATTPAFGSGAASSPTVFGVSTTSTTPAFGANPTGNVLAFGATTTAPAFGSSPAVTAPAFGSSAAVTTPAFGSSAGGTNTVFGATGATPAFGAAATGTTPAFGSITSGNTFGATGTGTTPAFGSPATGAPPAFGASTGATPAFGTGATGAFAFGNTSATATPSSGNAPFQFGSGQQNKPASSMFKFGSTPATAAAPPQAAPFAFGSGNASTTGFNFNAGGASNFNFSNSGGTAGAGFGQATTASPFGQAPTAAPPAFGLPTAPTPGGFPAAGNFMPGTFSIGAGTSQTRSRLSTRPRRR